MQESDNEIHPMLSSTSSDTIFALKVVNHSKNSNLNLSESQTILVSSETDSLLLTKSDAGGDKGDDNEIVALSCMQMFSLIVNTMSVVSCLNFLWTYESYILDDIGLSVTEMSYVLVARYVGSLFSFVFPTLLSKINKHCMQMQYRWILGVVHGLAGFITLSYIFLDDSLIFYIITRFLIGILVRIFSVYKNLMIINYAKSTKSWILNYSLIYIGYPLATFLFLIPFGFILFYGNFELGIIWISVPLILTSLLLFMTLPDSDISYSVVEKAKKDTNNDVSWWEYASVLKSINRCLKMFIGVLGAIKVAMFGLSLSFWFSSTYDLNSYEFYIVVFFECLGQISAIVMAVVIGYRKIINARADTSSPANAGAATGAAGGAASGSNAATSDGAGDEYKEITGNEEKSDNNNGDNNTKPKHDSTAIGLYTMSKVLSFVCFFIMYIWFDTLPIYVALLITFTMYFCSMVRNTTGGTLNMQLVEDIPNRRAQFSAYKLSFMSIGSIMGYYFGSMIYEDFGIRYIALTGMIVAATSSCCCFLLWYRMKRQNIC